MRFRRVLEMSERAQRILVRGVNWLGDAVMSTPALQRLREAKPGAHITLLTHEKLAGLWPGHPSIDDVMTFHARESVWSVGRRLRRGQFDVALVFPNSTRSALEVFLAGITQRIGYARGGRRILLTRALPARPGSVGMRKRSLSEIQRRVTANVRRESFPSSAHHIHDYLHLTAAIGANEEPLPPLLHVPTNEVVDLRRRFAVRDGVPLFALNAGAEYGPAKRWPVGRFVAAAVRLHQVTGCDWLLLGGAADATLAEQLAAEICANAPSARIINLAGQTSLRELCAALKACHLLLTNDTGPMHVAAAVGTPVVVPFGSTSPELTGPACMDHSPHQIVLGSAACAPCFLRECPIDFRCMNSIAVEQMVEAAVRAQRFSAHT